MSPIEMTPISKARAIGSNHARAGLQPAKTTPTPPAAAEPGVIGPDADLTPGPAAPIDAERVAEIRAAIEEGRYPLVPTRVADAMIAAGLLLIRGDDQ